MGSGKQQPAPPPEAPPPPPKPELKVDNIKDSSAAKNAQRNADRQAAIEGNKDKEAKGKKSSLGASTQSTGLSVG